MSALQKQSNSGMELRKVKKDQEALRIFLKLSSKFLEDPQVNY